jgi:LDH2 family malate/lactate/ureidoglycolate dehydrogenase
MNLEKKVDWEKVLKICKNIYMAQGLPEEDAFMVADNLMQAELSGVYSHGITRMKVYTKLIENNLVNVSGKIKIDSEHPALIHIDGCNCMGAVSSTKAVQLGIKKAKKQGSAAVSVRNSNHFGAAAYYTNMMAEEGLMGVSMTSAPPNVAPWGSYQGYLGTNPISFGVPSYDGPIVLDMATSIAARGKVLVMADKNEPVPEGWAIDRFGRPTTDAKAAADGTMLPIAGPKGYGLAFFIDMISGVMSGAAYGDHITNFTRVISSPPDIGHFFFMLDISKIMPLDAFKERAGKFCGEIKALPKIEGVSEIFLPGEIEKRKVVKNKQEGLMLRVALLDELKTLCEKYGVAFEL